MVELLALVSARALGFQVTMATPESRRTTTGCPGDRCADLLRVLRPARRSYPLPLAFRSPLKGFDKAGTEKLPLSSTEEKLDLQWHL